MIGNHSEQIKGMISSNISEIHIPVLIDSLVDQKIFRVPLGDMEMLDLNIGELNIITINL